MECELRLGETVVVRRRFFGRTWSVVYTGTPAVDRYSVALIWSMGHQASSYNVYLDASTRDVFFGGGRLRIQDMRPEKISFRYEAT